MSLPEFGGMDTGFNWYHDADPSEYDLLVSNSEGGLERLRELGARRAEAVFWGADPEFFAPQPVDEGERRLLLRLRRQVPARLDEGDGRRAVARAARRRLRARRPRLPGRHRRRAADRRHPVQRLRAARSRRRASTSASRDGRTRRSTRRRRAGRSSSRLPARRSSRIRTTASSAGSSRARSCSSSTTPTEAVAAYREPARRSRAGRGDRRAARASACSTSTPTATARGSCLSLVDVGGAGVKKIAIVPAFNEEGAIGQVIDELRAFDPELDVVVVDDASHDATAERARASAAPTSSRCRSTSGSAARCRPASATPPSTATSSPRGSTATASTIRPSSAALVDVVLARRGRHLRRLALRRRRRLPLVRHAARRDPHPRRARSRC